MFLEGFAVALRGSLHAKESEAAPAKNAQAKPEEPRTAMYTIAPILLTQNFLAFAEMMPDNS